MLAGPCHSPAALAAGMFLVVEGMDFVVVLVEVVDMKVVAVVVE